jgi:hypothetical protein
MTAKRASRMKRASRSTASASLRSGTVRTTIAVSSQWARRAAIFRGATMSTAPSSIAKTAQMTQFAISAN